MNQSPDELVAKVGKLASFPEVALRISEAVTDDSSSAQDIGALIEPDPALTAALLKIANSANYNVGGTVDSIERAVMIVGLREIRDLSFAICASKSFDNISNDLISVEDFWKHSLCCAVAAQLLAKRANVCRGESLFTMGLLHDIGQLVMFNQEPALSQQALLLSLDDNDGLTPHISEKEVFGFDHAEVGAALAEQWRFPENLQRAIATHHDIPDCQNVDAAMVVNVANSLAVLAEFDNPSLEDAPGIEPEAMAKLCVDEDSISEIVAETKEAVSELLKLFIN